MTEQQAELLVEYFDNVEEYEGTYSGRGMYGKSTHAVTCGSMGEFLEDIGNFICNDVDRIDRSELNEIGKAISGAQTDNMGHDIIIY